MEHGWIRGGRRAPRADAPATGESSVIFWYVLGGILALAFGVWVGLGHPGVEGREDRVVGENFRPRRMAKHRFLDWLRPPPPRR